ncbi:MAG: D-hexose-6-phosphate mutarotase [Noviherbaspirillum sp.]
MHPDASPTYASFPDALQDLPGIVLNAGTAGHAFVAAQGAQLLSWRAADGRERMYLSATTGGLTRSGGEAAAIRGGVPVCFPQFSDRGTLTKHGFVRNLAWQLNEHTATTLELRLHDGAASREQWPHAFEAWLSVRLEPGSLELTLTIINTGGTPFSFSTALHTYLRVEDVRQVQLLGLQDVRYQDATDNCMVKTQKEAHLSIPGEVDRVYIDPPDQLQLLEPGCAPLRISQRGFADTVVWNPGPDKARALVDMPDQDWLHMLCVEAACAKTPVTLAPGRMWEGSQRFSLD